MGAAIITDAGKNYLAAKQAAGLPAIFNQFVFANISGLDTSAIPSAAEGLPSAGNIKHTCAVTRAGYVTPDQVVYSVLLDSTVGDWSFNWVGLKADDGTLAALVYVPITAKEKYDSLAGHIGNNLTRNFLLQYDNLQTITSITVSAATWQIDFTQRLNASDAMQETLAKALAGNGALFLANGFKIENATGFKMRAGRAIIGGRIAEITADVDASLHGAAASKDIWLDVWRSGDSSGVTVHTDIVADIASATHNSYTDSNGIAHTVVKIASISAGGVVTDLRGTSGDLFSSAEIFDEFARIGHTHTPAQVGLGNLPNAKSDVAANDSNVLATIKCVFDAVAGAVSSAASNLAAHISNTANPHSTTAAQVGLGNLPNAKSDTASNNSNILATVKCVFDALATAATNLAAHVSAASAHTASQVGLGFLSAVTGKSDSYTVSNTNTLATSKALVDGLAAVPLNRFAQSGLIAVGTSYTAWNHGLGVVPLKFTVHAKVKVAIGSWGASPPAGKTANAPVHPVGALIEMHTYSSQGGSSGGYHGTYISANATSVEIGGTYRIDANGDSTVTSANCDFIFTAYA